MKHRWSLVTCLAVLPACNNTPPAAAPTSAAPASAAPATAAPEAPKSAAAPASVTVADAAFKDAAFPAPPTWKGRVFKLSADFPAEAPACTPETCPWLSVEVDFGNGTAPDFDKGGWAKYMAAILDYVKANQDPNLANEVGFRTEVDGQTRWYNVPWMAFDARVGREFVHGCTNERSVPLSAIVGAVDPADNVHRLRSKVADKACSVLFESWSVGYYNPQGGWAIGQAIPRTGAQAGVPQAVPGEGGAMNLKGLPFPDGTLVVKILTTSAPEQCVPALKGAPVWQVDRHTPTPDGDYLCARTVQESRILQMDVAVVDARSPMRWVYGTFVYNGEGDGATFWDRLQPLGVQWGSDGATWPAAQPEDSKPLQQTSLNPAVTSYEHEGCFGRLAGPVDNAQSSCMSCHAGAFGAAPVGTPGKMGGNIPPIFGFDGLCYQTDPPSTPPPTLTAQQLADNKAYFGSRPWPAPYADPKYAGAIPLDTSLQVQVALNQYAVYQTQNGQPRACKDKQ
ncbi:MAG: hypothetical protein KC549_14755 [Myxococcales bacterium]|nr:hypothetical protein [Myxococcales bacterium]MCB9546865.1 hypothetical protein [Myxococcales bacterium]